MPPTVTTAPLRPGFVTGLVTPLLAVAVGSLLALLAGAGTVSSLRTGARAWLVLQGSGIELGTDSFGLVPVGGILLAGALAAVVGRWAVPEPIEAVAPFAATVAGTCGVVAAVLASVTSTTDIVVHPVRAAVAAFVVSGVGAAVGVAARHGVLVELLPRPVREQAVARAALRAGVVAPVIVLAAAAAVVTALLVVHVDRASQLWALLDPGLGGALGLAVLCLLTVPTLVVWTASVLVGPGFELGTQTSVDLSGAQLGAVPGLPVLAALPSPGAFPDVVVVLGLVPLLAGVAAGWRVRPVTGWESLGRRAGLGALAGAVGGVVLGVVIGVSGGAVGPGRLADAGPPVLLPLLVAVPVLAVGGALGALGAHYRDSRAQQPRPGSVDPE